MIGQHGGNIAPIFVHFATTTEQIQQSNWAHFQFQAILDGI
jgi:hypothetical protein